MNCLHAWCLFENYLVVVDTLSPATTILCADCVPIVKQQGGVPGVRQVGVGAAPEAHRTPLEAGRWTSP